MNSWMIMDSRGAFLVEASKHRGSQAGYARLWSEEAERAMTFTTEVEAEAFVSKEFDRVEIDLHTIQPTSAGGSTVCSECGRGYDHHDALCSKGEGE